MRDIVIVVAALVASGYALKRPWIGIIAWVVVSIANPHRSAWGFAYDFPIAAVIALATLAGLLFTRDKIKLPSHAPVVFLALFTVWVTFTMPFAINSLEANYGMWNKVMKIMLMNFVALAVIQSRQQIQALVWAVALSLGFYGVKGGLFTLQTGGSFRVWGPPESFIEGNNEVALALIMITPLAFFLRQTTQNKWVKWALVGGAGLCAIASLGSQSRGALIAFGAMVFSLWLKSHQKVASGLGLLIVAPLMIAFMPDSWTQRMETIQTYEEDASAMGRINAWTMAWNLALDRPFGGGFQIYDARVFGQYAPIPTDIHAAHSIYFQVLGEHGFIGLALFLAIFIAAWNTARWNIRNAAGRADCEWVILLSRMTQVGFIGYAVGGAFLSLAYFDVPYYMMIALVVTRRWLEEQLRAKAAAQPAPAGRGGLAPSRGLG